MTIHIRKEDSLTVEERRLQPRVTTSLEPRALTLVAPPGLKGRETIPHTERGP
jgi:hypothetical protein